MKQKLVGRFLKGWAQAYQTNHKYALPTTDTDTCMHISILTADYIVKPVFKDHLKRLIIT